MIWPIYWRHQTTGATIYILVWPICEHNIQQIRILPLRASCKEDHGFDSHSHLMLESPQPREVPNPCVEYSAERTPSKKSSQVPWCQSQWTDNSNKRCFDRETFKPITILAAVLKLQCKEKFQPTTILAIVLKAQWKDNSQQQQFSVQNCLYSIESAIQTERTTQPLPLSPPHSTRKYAAGRVSCNVSGFLRAFWSPYVSLPHPHQSF